MHLKKYLPVLEWWPGYQKSDFKADLIAGVTVAIMLVPQGMAYALLAGMPPIYGLYGGLVPIFLYAILGTSRQMSIGPVAISALLVLAGVRQLAEPGSAAFVELVILAGLLIGLLQIVLSLLRMGFLVNFLSHPVVAGFTSAAAIIIAISQLKDLLGFYIPRFDHSSETLVYAIRHLGETNWIAVAMCVGSIVLMLFLRKLKRSFPAALTVVILSILLTWLFDLPSKGLEIVREVPQGLPAFQLPEFTFEKFQILIPTVLTVTIIGVVESIGIAKVLEAKHQSYVVRPNQELMALGISKLGGAFFQALPTSGSFTRSAVNNDTGARSGMASIITAILVGLTLVLFTPAFYYLPKAVLAAIILLAVRSLFDWPEAIYLWKTHRRDFFMMIITFIATLGWGIEQGVFTGVIFSSLAVLYRSSSPHIAILGKVPGTTSYRDMRRFEEATLPKDVLVVRFDDQLYFANAFFFKDTLKALVRDKGEQLKLLILDASSIHEIDSTGLQALGEMYAYLKNKGITFNLTGVVGPVRDILQRSGLMGKITPENHFLKTHDAILYFHAKEETKKEDWTSNAHQITIPDQEE